MRARALLMLLMMMCLAVSSCAETQRTWEPPPDYRSTVATEGNLPTVFRWEGLGSGPLPNRVERLLCIHICDEDLQDVFLHRELISLDIGFCRRVTDAGLTGLSNLTNLHYLSIYGSDTLSDTAFTYISELTNLETLECGRCTKMTGGDGAWLHHLLKLRRINLTNSSKWTDEALRQITGLPALEELGLGYCVNVSAQTVLGISHMKNLRVLSLEGCPSVSMDSASRVLENCYLVDVNLMNCSLIESAILSRASTTLEVVCLRGCDGITDETVGDAARLPRLRELYVWGCTKLTDQCLAMLRNSVGLRGLWIQQCPLISNDAKNSLKAAQPDLIIYD